MLSIVLSSISDLASKIQSAIQGSSAGNAIAERVERLSNMVCRTRAVLADVEERETTGQFDKLWLYELKEVTYDAENILSDFNYNWASMEMENQHQIDSRKRKFEVTDAIFSPRYDSSFLSRIERVTERFDEICRARYTLGLREDDGIRKLESFTRPPSSSFLNFSEIFGRDREKIELVKSLLINNEPSPIKEKTKSKEPSAIKEKTTSKMNVVITALVGMAGIGKSTLAKLVFNDEEIQEEFKSRAWVWVSGSYDAITITKSIIESFTGKECSLSQLDPLRNRLECVLAQKKFFLVLNDVREEISNHWEDMQWLLSYGAKGSCILITTENNTVAERMGTSILIPLSGLTTTDSWALFCHHAFNGKSLTMIDPKILKIGQRIVEKCNGVPLMVKSLAALLASFTEKRAWKYVLKSNVWDLEECRKNMHILSLSYYGLPAYLKPCFRSCAMFPKGHGFETDSLVRIWAAQGLIQAEDARQLEVGRMYVDDLMRRSFFHNKIIQGRKTKFTMHDLMHDLSTWIVGRETFIVENKMTTNQHSPSLIQNMEGLASILQIINENRDYHNLTVVVKNDGPIFFYPFQSCRLLRSLLIYSYNQTRFTLDLSFFNQESLKYLQVLDLNIWKAVELPESISNFKHLRFLGLSGQILPESICNLYNLQTLEMRTHGSHLSLPKNMRHLKNLKHLIFSPWDVSAMPIGIGGLTNLQTLSGFAVSKGGSAALNELNRLNNLRDELHITGLHHILQEHVSNCINPDLLSKEHLTHLTLQWSTFTKTQTRNNDEELLRILQPHTNIQYFVVDGYRGTYLPPWFGYQSYASMTYLKLDNCISCRLLPAIGQLPALKHLKLEGLKCLQTVGQEFYGYNKVSFPSLETLSFYDMPALENWYERRVEGSVFSCLRELHVSLCHKLRSLKLPNLPMLQKASFNWCKQLAGIEGLEGNWLVVNRWQGTSTLQSKGTRGSLRNKSSNTPQSTSSPFVLKLEKNSKTNNSNDVSPTLIVIGCPTLEQGLSTLNTEQKTNTVGSTSSTLRRSSRYKISLEMIQKVMNPTEIKPGSCTEHAKPDADEESKLRLDGEEFHFVDSDDVDVREEEQLIFDTEEIFSFEKIDQLSLGEKEQNSPAGSFRRRSPSTSNSRNWILLGVPIPSMISEPPVSTVASITPPMENITRTSY